MADFIGKDVSIKLKKNMGVFQGKIVRAESDSITINNPFHNGIKVKRPGVEVTLGKTEIESLEFVSLVDPVEAAARSVENTPAPVVPQNNVSKSSAKSPTNFTNRPFKQQKTTKPIPMRKTPNSSAPIQQQNKQDARKPKKWQLKNVDLMQPDDFSNDEEFDFESNLRLFDKKEIFKEIDNEHNTNKGHNNEKPDLVRQLNKVEEKYRCDENVLDGMLMQFRNVELEFKPKQEYTTTEPGILVPSIPQSLRNRIQNLAHDHGLTMERQNDFLARGTTELALSLLGGSRRFTPKNSHQWPKVVIICDDPYNFRQSEVGLSTARQLASHGLKVMVYVKLSSQSDKSSKELELFTATGNDITSNVKDLFRSDLVILSVKHMNQNSQIVRYINENRAQVMAIDPPATGIAEITIRNAVIPILPLDDINNTCGQLHLVNLCLSEKFYKDAGVRFSPIFGSRFIIPLHLKK